MKVGDLVVCFNDNQGYEATGVIQKLPVGRSALGVYRIWEFKRAKTTSWTRSYLRPMSIKKKKVKKSS